MKKCFNKEYDVVLSFAGEDRKYVERTASFLRKSGVKVFYDVYEDVNLWGKDLYQHLDDVYQNKGKYAIIFISEAYSKKLWTNHELKSAQVRAFTESEEYILPARFDDTEIPGIRKTNAYVNLKELTPIQFAKKIIKKLGDIEPENFLPDNIVYIRQIIKEINPEIEDETIDSHVFHVFSKLKKTTDKEKHFLAIMIMHACRHDITQDLHEDITLIERMSGYNRQEIMEILKSLTNLGFEYKISKSIHGCKEEGNEQEYELLSLNLTSRQPELEYKNLTAFLPLMYFGAMSSKCESCCLKTLKRLDFSDLQNKVDENELEVILSYIPDA
jgi:uncharacterized protein (UPF0335 family)